MPRTACTACRSDGTAPRGHHRIPADDLRRSSGTPPMRPWRGVECGGLRTVLVALPLLLAGCASTAIQENQAATSAFALREVGVEVQLQSTAEARAAAATNARTLLAEPLTADGAVQIAVGYSPTFQRMLADSAAASAAATQSARLPNPILSYSRLAAGDVTGDRSGAHPIVARFRLAAAAPPPRRPAAGAASTAQCRGRDRDRHRSARGVDRRGGGTAVAGVCGSRRKRRPRPAPNSAGAWRLSAIFRAWRRPGSKRSMLKPRRKSPVHSSRRSAPARC